MQLFFRINLSFDNFLPYYQGTAEMIQVKDDAGRLLWIHGRHLRRYLTREGIRGHFRLELDQQGKFVSIEKLE
ncbi:DUF2835 domain-containing protein [Shewanella sedimentimangrovi]|uniref:DUF2835 domain-containing protein n=1 Tax=Shewanella sedimentimangrovi TaxID=2814293 RepID=A0ABX7QXN7_9GAMM|nr:DUF2835 domain-containing protein [Shewanella sedimentimangrovi]QSX35725.1 DUF2835 domain-containing protein [Shewanella sedimentimangrovi]